MEVEPSQQDEDGLEEMEEDEENNQEESDEEEQEDMEDAVVLEEDTGKRRRRRKKGARRLSNISVIPRSQKNLDGIKKKRNNLSSLQLFFFRPAPTLPEPSQGQRFSRRARGTLSNILFLISEISGTAPDPGDQPFVSLEHKRKRRKKVILVEEIEEEVEDLEEPAELPQEQGEIEEVIEQPRAEVHNESFDISVAIATQVNEVSSSTLVEGDRQTSGSVSRGQSVSSAYFRKITLV